MQEASGHSSYQLLSRAFGSYSPFSLHAVGSSDFPDTADAWRLPSIGDASGERSREQMARWATTITPLAGSGNSCGSAGKPGVGDSHVANALLLEKCLPLMKDHYCVDEICYLLSVPHSAFWEMVSENPGQFQLYYVVANLWPVCGTNTASSRLVQHLQKGAAVAPNLLWGDRAAHRLRLTPAPHAHLADRPPVPRHAVVQTHHAPMLLQRPLPTAHDCFPPSPHPLLLTRQLLPLGLALRLVTRTDARRYRLPVVVFPHRVEQPLHLLRLPAAHLPLTSPTI